MLLRPIQTQQYYGRLHGNYKPCIRRDRQNNQFFRKPYLEIDSDLDKIEKKLHVGKQRHVFETIIWALEVKNRKEHRLNIPWTISAIDCKPNIHFSNIGQSVPIRWRMYRPEPTVCVTDGQPDTPKTEYLGLLGCYYARDELADKCGVNSILLNPGDTQKLYFLFTFQGSKFAYVITPIENTTWYGEHEIHYCSINGAFLFLEIPGEYDFVIRFDRENHKDINGQNYKLKIDDWDKITMSRS
jgi:hypothetical protein